MRANERRPRGVNIDIITGRFNSHQDEESLLLFRVYDFKKKVNSKKKEGEEDKWPTDKKVNLKKKEGEEDKWPTDKALYKLYKHCLKKLCKKGGFEVNRHGGSSGKPVLDRHFFNFLHWYGCFPRKAGAIKFIKLDRGWMCVYMRARPKGNLLAATYVYSPPKRGGQFNVSADLLREYPFLYDFAETKITAALILEHLTSMGKMAPVQRAAVIRELSVLESSIKVASNAANKVATGASGDPGAITCEDEFRLLVIEHFVSRNKHTLVQHPVGFHLDVFARGAECLENKICIALHGQHTGDPMGRGGKGHKTKVVCFLDWGT